MCAPEIQAKAYLGVDVEDASYSRPDFTLFDCIEARVISDAACNRSGYQ